MKQERKERVAVAVMMSGGLRAMATAAASAHLQQLLPPPPLLHTTTTTTTASTQTILDVIRTLTVCVNTANAAAASTTDRTATIFKRDSENIPMLSPSLPPSLSVCVPIAVEAAADCLSVCLSAWLPDCRHAPVAPPVRMMNNEGRIAELCNPSVRAS